MVGLAVLALAIERGLLRFLYGKEHLMQLLFTFAIVLLMSDAAKMIWGTDQYSVGYPQGLGGAASPRNFASEMPPDYPIRSRQYAFPEITEPAFHYKNPVTGRMPKELLP